MVSDGLWAIVSPDAAPMTKGTIDGKLLAELICGVDSGSLQITLSLSNAALLPTDPILRSAVDRTIANFAQTGPGER